MPSSWPLRPWAIFDRSLTRRSKMLAAFKWTLKWESSVRKMASESSNTSGTEETPFLDSATHRYCLMAFTNIS
ncbi:hypothetical protein EYF80_056355 [Liparis tanakae]|uniref:Uncharacterized protein n=1 Tax=Liparis tanakae TaxID=230148 RepID=A0A4Z2EYP4_9TELE|nr:hypothetical protein EYF80_056355 [Liparis tanakae]